MARCTIVIMGVVLAACSSAPSFVENNGVRAEFRDDGIVISVDGADVWRSAEPGVGASDDARRRGEAYGLITVATTESRFVEEVFGYYRFNESISSWRALQVSAAQVENDVLRLQLEEGATDDVSVSAQGDVPIPFAL